MPREARDSSEIVQSQAAQRVVAQRLAATLQKGVERVHAKADGLKHAFDRSWLANEISQLDRYIADAKPERGYVLTPEGEADLAEARAYRRELGRRWQELTGATQAQAEMLSAKAWQVEKALPRLQRLESEPDQLRGMLEQTETLNEFWTAADRRVIDAARSYLKQLNALAEAEAERARAEQAEAEAAEAILRVYLPLLPHIEHYPFQINTARQVLRTMRGRALLCDEVGLGKTIEAGLILKEYLVRGLARKVLVLAPPALVSQWQNEMSEKFGIDFVTHDDPSFRALGEAAWAESDRVIASLHTAKNPANSAAIHQIAYDIIIVDEAHHLKNRTTVNWKFVNGLKSRYLLLLTATPVQNDLDELFNLITLLSPGQLKTASTFRRDFVARGDGRKPKNRTRLRELLMDVMVRNTRSQVSVALPPRRDRLDDPSRAAVIDQKIAAASQERERKLRELGEKHRLREKAELTGVRLLLQPKTFFNIVVDRGRSSRTVTLAYDSVLDRLEPPVCSKCGAETSRIRISPEAMLLCPACTT